MKIMNADENVDNTFILNVWQETDHHRRLSPSEVGPEGLLFYSKKRTHLAQSLQSHALSLGVITGNHISPEQ